MPIYELECKSCGRRGEWFSVRPTDDTPPCPSCGGEAEKLYSLFKPKVFQQFTTTNLHPDGKPITVHDSGHLKDLQREFGVVMVDDDTAPPQTKFPEPDLSGGPPSWWQGEKPS